MQSTFHISEFRTVKADLDLTIAMQVVDTRVPGNSFDARELTLEQYNERVAFLIEHDHIFGMNMAKDKFNK